MIQSGKQHRINKNIFAFTDKVHEKGQEKWKDFPQNLKISQNCNCCGYCQMICPAKNIVVDKEGVHFLGKCVSCLACYHRCPRTAINFSNKTIGKKRYINPNVNFDDMK